MKNRLKLGSLDYVEKSRTYCEMSNSKMKDVITQEIVDEYMSSLKDLTSNNKAQINCLTILAEDYIEHAPAIVHAVEDHLQKVTGDIKLPVLYLIDSIVKNVNKAYLSLFTKSVVNTFCSVFEKVDEHTRSCMWKLRQTWNEVFPVRKLYALDVGVHQIDPAWPIVPLPANSSSKSIHVNPKFISVQQQQSATKQKSSSKRVPTPPKELVTPVAKPLTNSEAEMREQLLKKRKELIELQKQKVELELLQARASLEQQRRQMDNLPSEGALDNSTPVVPSSQATKVAKKFATSLLKSESNKSGVKIIPASSIAIASAKPISRDPRLKLAANAEEQIMQQLKLHTLSKLSGDQSSLLNDANKRTSEPELTTINNKSLDIKRAKESNQKKEPITSTTATTTTTAITDTTSTTTTSQRNNSISKDQSKSLSSKGSSRSSSSSSKSSSSSSSRKLGSKSRPKSSSSSPNKVAKLEENSSPSDKRSSSSKKSKSHKSSHSSPSPSPPLGTSNSVTSFRIPRRVPTQESPVTPAGPQSSGKSPALDEEVQSSSLIASLPPTGATPTTSFKEIRSNTRLRNYIRRNKEGSRSPESNAEDGKDTTSAKLPDASKDEDLRPPIVNVTAGAALDTKDLDLRVLAVPTKRPSPDILEAPSLKRSKAEKFDALFGNEDVDLRTLTNPKAGRPPTPPPPMISSSDSKKNTGWAKLKTPVKTERDTPKPVDRSRDRLGRPRIHKTSASSEDAKDRKLRGPPMARDAERHNDRNIEIIMKDAAEQLDAGIITKAQYNTLIQEVLHMSEDQKLRAAQRKEAQESGMTVWEKGEGPPGFAGDDGQGRKPEHPGMHPRAGGAGGPRWQGPWHQPWAHPPPFPGGPPPHGFPDGFRPMGPWPGPPPRLFGSPMRPDFHPPFGFNPRMGPPPPMGPNGPIMMPNGPMGPTGPMNQLRPGGPMGPMPPGMMMNGPIRPQEMANKRSSPNTISATGPAGAAAPIGGAKHEAEKEVAAFKTMVNSAELPPADPKIIEEVTKDTMRSINIDGIPREIRYYGNIGVIFMHWDDPRDISFKDDTRRVIIDSKETLLCNFNEDYREFTYEGEIHRIKLGTPTRELYVDDKWYQCYFGGQPITVDLGNKKVSIKLDGPPPEVKYGTIKRTDLVLGKINLIINARNMVPVFLDAKPQMFEIEGKQCTLQFTDALQTVLLNGRPFKVEFGGLPKPIVVQGKKHFIRFSVLPRGFRAGHVRITGMAGEQPKEVDPLPTDIQKPEALVPSLTTMMPPTTSVAAAIAPIAAVNSSLLPGLDLNSAPPNVTAGATTSKPDLSLDILSSVMPSSMAPPSGLSYQAEPAENPILGVTLPMNLDELFQKLVDTGIIPSLSEMKKQEEEKKPEMVLVSFDKPDSLKQKQPAMVATLYSGMQCSSCGERFATEMATRYSHHLDWHFRQNRKERDSTKKAHSRSWFYDVSDWIQFEEIEDVDERAQSWFETEKLTAETEGTSADDDPGDGQQPSIPTGPDADSFCQVCHEPFEQFYNEEKEEWHLRPAVVFEEKNYHPLCLEDHKRALEKSAMVLEETIAEMEEESKKTEEDKEDSMEVEGEEKKADDLEVKPENIKTEIKEEKDDKGEKGKEGASAVELEKIKKEKEEKEKKENEEKQKEKEKENEKPEEESAEASAGEKEQQMDVDDSEPIEIIEPLPRKIELEEIDDSSDDERADDAAKEARPRRERRREEKVPDDIPLIFENVKVKEEPIDLDDEPEESIAEAAAVDTTQVEVKSSIDGNVELQSAAPTIPTAPSKIKINITKALPVVSKDNDESKEKKPAESPVEAAPAKPLIPAAIKPSLQGKKLSILPTVEKGHELSGLCSIM